MLGRGDTRGVVPPDSRDVAPGGIVSPAMRDTIIAHEDIARRVAGETLADLRTVRREMREPGSVCGPT
jgi:hypothetical protein